MITNLHNAKMIFIIQTNREVKGFYFWGEVHYIILLLVLKYSNNKHCEIDQVWWQTIYTLLSMRMRGISKVKHRLF